MGKSVCVAKNFTKEKSVDKIETKSR